VAVLPAEIPTGLVTGQFYFVNEDNVDADTDPDLTVVTGNVTLTCSAKKLRMPTKLATVVPLEFQCAFDSQGRLVAAGDPTKVGVEVPATNSALFNPTNFTWRVDFDLVQVDNRHTVKIDSFDIQVPEGQTTDLTLAMPVDTSPGVLTVQGPQGIQGPTGPTGLTGAGVPAGGTALQYIRKNAANTTTEWASGLLTTSLANNAKPDTDAPSTYPLGVSHMPVTSNGFGVNFGTVVTVRTGLANRTVQTVTQSSSGLQLTRVEIATDAWGSWYTTNVDVSDTAATPNALVKRNSGGDIYSRRQYVTDQPTTVDQVTRKDYVDGQIDTKIDAKLIRPLLATGTDLNTISTSAQVGTYGLYGGTDMYPNAPAGVLIPSTATLELLRSTNAGAAQRITAGALMWFREAQDTAAGTWFAWTQVSTLDSAGKVPVSQLPAATTSVAGTMSAADKTLLTNATSAPTANTLTKLDANGRAQVANPAVAADIANKSYVDTADALKVAKGELLKNVRDYWQAGDADFTAAINRAHGANTNVAYPLGHLGVSVSNENALTNTIYTDAQGLMLRAGRRFNPVTDPSPVLWVEKFDNSSRDTPNDPATWDSGAGHFNVVKEGGTAPSIALIGYNRNVSTEPSGVGGSIGVHGRAATDQIAPGIWGAWFYTAGTNSTTPPSQMIGVEINLNHKAPDQGWMQSAGTGASRMLVAVTQDNSSPITIGIDIGRGTNASNGFIHTALLLRANSVTPSGANSATAMNNNEAIRIEGDSSIGNGSTGIRFRGGFKTLGISFQETGFANNAAMLFADDQRMVVGPGPASSTWVSLNKTTAQVNFNGLALAMNATKVVGSRVTGWGVASGTVDKTAWSTYTAPTVSAAYVQAELQAIANAVQANSRHLAALQQDLTTHGLIGA